MDLLTDQESGVSVLALTLLVPALAFHLQVPASSVPAIVNIDIVILILLFYYKLCFGFGLANWQRRKKTIVDRTDCFSLKRNKIFEKKASFQRIDLLAATTKDKSCNGY